MGGCCGPGPGVGLWWRAPRWGRRRSPRSGRRRRRAPPLYVYLVARGVAARRVRVRRRLRTTRPRPAAPGRENAFARQAKKTRLRDLRFVKGRPPPLVALAGPSPPFLRRQRVLHRSNRNGTKRQQEPIALAGAQRPSGSDPRGVADARMPPAFPDLRRGTHCWRAGWKGVHRRFWPTLRRRRLRTGRASPLTPTASQPDRAGSPCTKPPFFFYFLKMSSADPCFRSRRDRKRNKSK